MKRKKQILFFIICSISLLCLRGLIKGGYSSAEELLEAYAKTNHMGRLEEVLIEEEYDDYTFILGRTEKGLVYLDAEKDIFNDYVREYSLLSSDELSYAHNGVVIDYITSMEGWHGYAEQKDIDKLICWTGNNSRTCEKITLYPNEKGLFCEAEKEREVINLAETGSIWQPGGSRSWNSSVKHVYAVKGLNKNGTSVYWYSEYGFTEDDFNDAGYPLLKKIFDRVVDVD